jgi:hypothetical protein
MYSLLAFTVIGGSELLWNFFYRIQHSYREAQVKTGKVMKPFNWVDKILYKVYSRQFDADLAMEIVKLGSEKYALVKLTDGYYVGGHVLDSQTPNLYLDTYDSKHIIGMHKFEGKPKFFMVRKDSVKGAEILHTVDEFHRRREEVAPMVAGALVSRIVQSMQGENE